MFTYGWTTIHRKCMKTHECLCISESFLHEFTNTFSPFFSLSILSFRAYSTNTFDFLFVSNTLLILDLISNIFFAHTKTLKWKCTSKYFTMLWTQRHLHNYVCSQIFYISLFIWYVSMIQKFHTSFRVQSMVLYFSCFYYA